MLSPAGATSVAKHKEGIVERYFIERVQGAGGMTRKAQWIGRRGCPDQFWALGGRCGFAEIKAPGCKPEAHQQREIDRLRSKGVNTYVIDSLDAVDRFIGNYT